MDPFLIIAATDPNDPIVGSAFVARNSLSSLHNAIFDRCKDEFDPCIIYTGIGDTTLINSIPDYVTSLSIKDGEYLIDILGSINNSGTPLAQTNGVFFDDAMSFDVDMFVNAWYRLYPYIPIPPMYGMVHTLDRGGYCHPSFKRWNADQLKKLSSFERIFVASETAANYLNGAGLTNVNVTAPCFFNAYENITIPGRLYRPNQKDEIKLNWMYSFSHIDNYDKYILMVRQLNDIIKERIADESADKDEGVPARFSPYIYSNGGVPDGVVTPAGIGDPNSFCGGEILDFALMDDIISFPPQDSVTVSFRGNLEVDYRILALADLGYMVLVPDSGAYVEFLDPVCMYPHQWLNRYSTGIHDMATKDISREFFERILHLRTTWGSRHGNKNGLSGRTVKLLRPAVRNRISIAAEEVADRIISSIPDRSIVDSVM